MANPSATPASAAGTEILRRSYYHALSTSPQKIIDGAANHTYTVLSVTAHETAGANEQIYMYVDVEASGTQIWLINQWVNAYETFVFNDKILLWDTDELVVMTGGDANLDIYCTYIEQRWA